MNRLNVRVMAKERIAEGVVAVELMALDGSALPAFTAGGHIDLHLREGIVRSYSLCNSQRENDRYVIAVNRDNPGRGGSAYVHDELAVDDVLEISLPRNNFSLDEEAGHTVLIAGGIGITPLLSMIRRLVELDRSWELLYCARSRSHAAFADVLQDLARRSSGGQVRFHFDDEACALPDLGQVLQSAAMDVHFYCCGPVAMIEAFLRAADGVDRDRLHLEYFRSTQAAADEGGFMVELARSGKQISVAEGETILEAVLQAGVDMPYSCMQGTCGSCQVAVLEGVPDHRDMILTDDERASNAVMMICCSGSKSPKLIIDC